MSQEYFAILTAIGEAKDAQARAGGVPLKLTHMVVGDGADGNTRPEPAQTQLVREVYRAPLNQLSLDPVNTSQVIAECVIPDKDGGWWIREIGLLDEDGDLVAVANCPPSYKPQMPEGSARTQVIRMVLIVSSADTVQLSIDPGIVMATRAYADGGIEERFTALAAPGGSAMAGFHQDDGDIVARSVQDKLRDVVSIMDFYEEGDIDHTVAAQRATNTGSAVFFPDGEYIIHGVTYTGRVVWFGHGGATIKSDGPVLTVEAGSGSRIQKLRLENITPPWIIVRDAANLSAPPALVKSNGDGYQPTVNDFDVWPTLTVEQQKQDIGPTIKFYGNASDIQVSFITGRFVNILVFDAQASTVHDCNFRGGRNFAGGIVFWNINQQYGRQNRALNNIVSYASNSGIAMARQLDGVMQGNVVSYVGESGLKTYQGMIGDVDARCYRMQIQNNNSLYAFYDGFDLSSDYPHTGLIDSRHVITGNMAFGARSTGFYADGKNNVFTNNQARGTGLDGMFLGYSDSLISSNHVYGANLSNKPTGTHQMQIAGNGNNITNNILRQFSANGFALYAPGTNYCTGNSASDGEMFFGNSGAVSSILIGNQDSAKYASTTRPQQFRQTQADVAAVKVYSESLFFDNVDIDFQPRKLTIDRPIARIRGLLSYGEPGNENGVLVGYAAQAGQMVPGFIVQTDNNVPNKAWLGIYAPNIKVPPEFLNPGTVAMALDEGASMLNFSVKYSNGTVKSARLALA